MRTLKKSLHYRSRALSTHGISSLQILDGWSQVGDCHVEVVILEELPSFDERFDGFSVSYLSFQVEISLLHLIVILVMLLQLSRKQEIS